MIGLKKHSIESLLWLDDVLERMMDDRSATDSKLLTGHSGPVYAARFSRDRKYLVSCSEDGTGQV